MRTIYKHPVELTGCQTIELPRDCILRHVGLDPFGDPCIWAEVDTAEKALEKWLVFIVGTGHRIEFMESGDVAYFGSFLMPPFVWHVYCRHGS